MNQEHYKNLLDSKEYNKDYPKLLLFIKMLIAVCIPLDCIDTNDWGCNLRPSIYVHNQQNRFIMRRYGRCAVGDVSRAVKFHLKLGRIPGRKCE